MNTLEALRLDGPIAPGLPAELADRFEFAMCCMGAAAMGLEHCTCWQPKFNSIQAPSLQLGSPTLVQPKCCFDCAYRPGSPEWADEEKREQLLDLPAGAGTFWCHQGIRRVLSWTHPAAPELVIPSGGGDYRPPIEAARPYQADGTPALICGGWAAHAGHEQLDRVIHRLELE